jgi:hypothetical protein
MKKRDVPMLRTGDPVANNTGDCIGYVMSNTSTEGVQVSMAYIEAKCSSAGTKLARIARPRTASDAPEKDKAQLALGDKVAPPEEAVVLSRFMVARGLM